MKKLNKFFAVLVALAMMATLCVSMAFAADDEPTYEDATANLTKVLQMPEETSAPSGDFIFTVTAAEGQETVAGATDNLKVTYDGEKGTAVKKTDKLFDGVEWPHAGVYTYTIKEARDAESGTYQAGTNENLTYDKSEYKVEVSVKNKPGTTDEVYVAAIYITKTVDENGDKITNPSKVSTDPSDDYGELTEGTFSFVNKFYKTTNVDPDGKEDKDDDPNDTKDDTGLYVEKTVKGELGDKTKDFTFTVTVTKPTLSNKTIYHAKVVDTNAQNTKAAVNVETTATKNPETYELTFTSGTSATVALKDGYRLVFEDLDIGATYTVTETKDSDYTVKVNGQSIADEAAATATGTVKETANTNFAKVENTSKDDEIGPEGILISNLPYIALALVAIGGLVAYVVVRRRNADEA